MKRQRREKFGSVGGAKNPRRIIFCTVRTNVSNLIVKCHQLDDLDISATDRGPSKSAWPRLAYVATTTVRFDSFSIFEIHLYRERHVLDSNTLLGLSLHNLSNIVNLINRHENQDVASAMDHQQTRPECSERLRRRGDQEMFRKPIQNST